MMVILDVTAGNRKIWSSKKDIPGVIFIDKESGLLINQDIMADNTHLPIRIDLKIDSIIFDPPWMVNPPPWFNNKKHRTGSGGITYYGSYNSKKEIVPYINSAFIEFKKYTNRVCMKWGDSDIPLYRMLGFIKRSGWILIKQIELKSKRNRGGNSKTANWWVVLERDSGVWGVV